MLLTLARLFAMRRRAVRASRRLAVSTAVIALMFMVVQPFVAQLYYVPTRSMEPTLRPGDFVLGMRRPRLLALGDVVVLRPPSAASDDRLHIKRIVGLSGDVVEIVGGRLVRNGTTVSEPYARDVEGDSFKLAIYRGETVPVRIGRSGLANYDSDVAPLFAVGWDSTKGVFTALDRLTDEQAQALIDLRAARPAPVPPGYILVFGDNRPGSQDSRQWGLVRRDDVAAKVTLILFPLSRAGRLP